MADLKPIRTPIDQRMLDIRRRVVPVVVWCTAALICAVMMFGRAQRFEYIGLAQAQRYEVSTSSAGTLGNVVVSLFDAVEPGDIVATLDDSQVKASLETARAELQRLTAELGAERSRVGTDSADRTADLRRFQIDEEQRRLAALSLKVVIESDRIDLERLELEVARARGLLSAGILGQIDFDATRLSRDMVQKKIEKNRALLDETEVEYSVARNRREEFERNHATIQGDAELAPLREAITVASYRMTEIELQRQALILRSPVAGQVSELLCRRGQAVLPGEPILAVTETTPREIVAFVTEANDEAARQLSRVRVASRTDPDQAAESMVLRVSPAVQELPQRLWRDPRVPDYGRAVVIAGVPALELTPGEVVSVRFLPSD